MSESNQPESGQPESGQAEQSRPSGRQPATVISTTPDRAATQVWMLFLVCMVVAMINLATAATGQRWAQVGISLVMFVFFTAQMTLWRGARISRLAVSDEGLFRLSGGPVSAATGWQAPWDQITEAHLLEGSGGPVLVVRVKNPPRVHPSRWFVWGLTIWAKQGAYVCQLDPAAVAAVGKALAEHDLAEHDLTEHA